jgi:EAL domain-containing protein (putative c-di-GMP-specific phosphodiesterase class I)
MILAPAFPHSVTCANCRRSDSRSINWLLAHGCHIGQGYFFSPPVPPEDVVQVVERIEVRLAA